MDNSQMPSASASSASAIITANDLTANTNTSKYTGRVKWFNNKSGYGFVTAVSSDSDGSVAVGSDVFAHHSEIAVGADQYRYLVQGEYVEFNVVKTTSGNHEFQCSKIRGIHSGQLICETRHAARELYKNSPQSSAPKHNSSTPFEMNALNRGTGSSAVADSSSGSGERKYSGSSRSSARPFRGRGGTNTRGGKV